MKRGANSGILQEGSGLSRKILDAFAVQAKEVKGNTADIKEGMRGIATVVEESARGIVMAADAASELVDNLASIQAEMTDNHHIANELRQEVNKFHRDDL